MSYETAAAPRVALEARLVNAARATGTDLDRRRRRVVFERILARLATTTGERWILKGGFALEVRLGDRARATRDLDVALGEPTEGGADVRDALIDTLATAAGDDFTFAVARQQEIVPDEAGRPGWRFSVTATLAGREFQRVRVDVVARPEEIAGRTEHIRMPTFLDFAGLDDLSVEAVDRRQHFAEKLHALTRDYGDRLNTRVRTCLTSSRSSNTASSPTRNCSLRSRRSSRRGVRIRCRTCCRFRQWPGGPHTSSTLPRSPSMHRRWLSRTSG